MQTQYDYIFTGTGCAALSLLLRLMHQPYFKDKKILLIDKDAKQTNDRTWCFWETKNGLFEDIVYKRWQQIDFYSDAFSARFDIAPYTYKMLRGIDFYNYIFGQAASYRNIEFLQAHIVSISNEQDKAIVHTDSGIFSATYIFNSIIFDISVLKKEGSLLQHFKGWMIDAPAKSFNSNVATFMDFTASRQHDNSFVYMLPVTDTKALVEFTVFSPSLLKNEEYEAVLQAYIKTKLNIQHYTITEEEMGVIPMTIHTFPAGDGCIVNIGTSGGQTKASSGYTFNFVQKHSEAIVHALLQQKNLVQTTPLYNKRFHLYDNTLLNILYKKKTGAGDIFSALFRKNKPQQIFKFLDNETSVAEELKIMNTVPMSVFLPAALQQLFK